MFSLALQPLHGLGAARRIRPLVRHSDRLTSGELATLLLAGAFATVAVAAFSPAWRIPGHAILRATLPMVCGMALVPRRFGGSVMTVGAGAAALALSAIGFGNWQPAAVVSLLALGPAIDIAMTGRATTGWRLYLRFALAGILANSLSFGVRFATFAFQHGDGRPRTLTQFSVGVFLSFAACGALAGLLSAVFCFRSSANAK